ncbi:MAG TPA: peptide chain release factor N(5)-glutamine methyltransferase [Chloroflexi bacterium]|nr:peptide chain release factor N(5)-glutamine methyltransferase [Chloroflexota bacterium]
MLTITAALAEAQAALAPHSETAALDAQTLLAAVLHRDRAWLLAHPEARLTPRQHRRLRRACTRLAQGEPLPYVLGYWHFYGRKFALTPAVLIPRPETETLVELALAWLRQHPTRRRAADVGTGSGIIAVTLAAEIAGACITATDISLAALAVAADNARRYQVADRIVWLQTDLLAAAPGPFDLIVANPPYIPTEALNALPVARHEPRGALDGGPDGLALIRRLLAQARSRLAPGGLLLLEIAADQGEAARVAALAAFPKAETRVLPDLAGHDRVVAVVIPDS